MLTRRTSGILLHPTSLPGRFGGGDFGADAYRFVDWLADAGQSYWQMLPLGEIGAGNSPYMCRSAFAGNALLIDLEELAGHGWLTPEDLVPPPGLHPDRVDYAIMRPFRMNRLRHAYVSFFSLRNNKMKYLYDVFCKEEGDWLDDYALFMAIATRQDWKEWNDWPEELAHRDAQALRSVAESSSYETGFWKFCQWCFARQWLKLKNYAHARGVEIIGDVPIFVAHQSADVWAHPELFELDGEGRSTVVAGVPPDYFSQTGQLWGNPLYRWRAHEETGYSWWIARMKHALKLVDMVRIDHFRGFAAYWEIPAGAPDATGGRWVAGPGENLFEALHQAIPDMPIIAEDLGVITPDVMELRDKFNLPGLRVLQFAFGEGEDNYFLPHHYIPNTVAYTGTHDNDTSLGWWNSASGHEKNFASHYLRSDGHAINRDMMRAISASAANTVIFPMQDVLGLCGDHRMNYPGHADGNWEWRFSWDQLQPEQTRALAQMSAEHHRL
ncbi:MAG: 4-alpha-glucanotransferase [Gallionellales bacterium GWA2_60_18]|nr:MAG: 4-alpha-glucanotransferase [Gallionellales bacterium GWA2_60_18]